MKKTWFGLNVFEAQSVTDVKEEDLVPKKRKKIFAGDMLSAHCNNMLQIN